MRWGNTGEVDIGTHLFISLTFSWSKNPMSTMFYPLCIFGAPENTFEYVPCYWEDCYNARCTIEQKANKESSVIFYTPERMFTSTQQFLRCYSAYEIFDCLSFCLPYVLEMCSLYFIGIPRYWQRRWLTLKKMFTKIAMEMISDVKIFIFPCFPCLQNIVLYIVQYPHSLCTIDQMTTYQMR